MTSYIKGVKNEAPFYYFEEISKIPRASRNEKQIAEYLVSFAKELGLECYKDELNNVFITKEASYGRENEGSILLQAHTDMVAEKNAGTTHNFDTDPIELVQDGNRLFANGTTLGADDGFGVAIIMAILASDTISHPKIEALLTSSEEIGLVGAGGFDYSLVKSKNMINLDSAMEDTIIIGCCGGIRTELEIPVTQEKIKTSGYKITIGGLQGGHSGEDIDLGRLNSHKLMYEILSRLNSLTGIRIEYITGGDKDNAIPRECEATIVPDSEEKIKSTLDTIEEEIRKSIKAREDDGLFVKVEKKEVSTLFSYADTERLLLALSVPNAVLEYRTVEPILPHSSRNLARIRTEKDKISIGFSSRSYLEAGLDKSTGELDMIAEKIGAKTIHHEKYPGWASDKDIDLVKKWQSAYTEATGKTTMPTLIHAGLECGLITSAVDGLEAIAIGANVHDLHTPKETMEIDSMDRIYDTVVAFLQK